MGELTSYIIGPLCCYLIGSIPAAYILVKLLKGIDVRTLGSGNVGATNAARAFAPEHRARVFTTVFVMDILKGMASVAIIFSLLHNNLDNPLTGAQIAGLRIVYGLLAIVGHIWPVYLSFQGGKGVATSAGVLLIVAPYATLIAAVVWLITVLATKYISLGSILAAASLSIGFVVEKLASNEDPFGQMLFTTTSFCMVISVLVLLRHRSNIQRLVAGTESRIKL